MGFLRRARRTVLLCLAAALLGSGGTIYVWRWAQRTRDLRALVQDNRHLRQALARLAEETQVGLIEVLDVHLTPDGPVMDLRFRETAPGRPDRIIQEHRLRLTGEEIYADALVVRFPGERVADGQARALFLWRRIFTDEIPPKGGFPLQPEGQPPRRYAGWLEALSLPQQFRFWEEIWDLAHHPDRLADLGVRAIHGQSVSVKARAGGTYRVSLGAAGDLILEVAPPTALPVQQAARP